MFGIEEVTFGEADNGKGIKQYGLPPGFRFHPTDEELIAFYLASKLFKPSNFHGVNIAEVDLNRCEPWELPEEARMGEREWYFFSLRVRKYPTGLRTNRATVGGYWKGTGKDRQIESSSNGVKLGTKKTLVFYKGGAPKGLKTKWVLHEYRLHSHLASHNPCKDEWVLCRIIHKSGEKIKPRTFQIRQTCLQEPSPLSVPSPISLPTLSLHTPQTIHHNNDIQFQAALHDPQFIFQSNLFPFGLNIDNHLSPPSSLQGTTTSTDFFGHFNPPLLVDSIACGGWEVSSFAVDGGALVDVAGGRGESSDENRSGGC